SSRSLFVRPDHRPFAGNRRPFPPDGVAHRSTAILAVGLAGVSPAEWFVTPSFPRSVPGTRASKFLSEEQCPTSLRHPQQKVDRPRRTTTPKGPRRRTGSRCWNWCADQCETRFDDLITQGSLDDSTSRILLTDFCPLNTPKNRKLFSFFRVVRVFRGPNLQVSYALVTPRRNPFRRVTRMLLAMRAKP